MTRKNRSLCAYCGRLARQREHTVPRSLYPASLVRSRFRRIVVPACEACNKSWQDDEVHFRMMLLLCGASNPVVNELWDGPARRSFHQKDAHRRLRDVVDQMVAVGTRDGERHKIYPDRDLRFMRVVRKIVRGLCYHHDMDGVPVPDELVWVGALRHEVPVGRLATMNYAHADPRVLRYFYETGGDHEIQSAWLLNFYGRTSFISVVYRSVESRERTVMRAT